MGFCEIGVRDEGTFAENDYFDQRLECAAPKPGLKYTTVNSVHNMRTRQKERIIFCWRLLQGNHATM